MAIPSTVNDRELLKFKESVSTPNQPAIAIVNPDGTNIGGSGGTSMTDDSAFVPGASSLTPAGFIADDTAPDPIDEGDVGAARMNPTTRIQYVQLKDSAGADVAVGGGTQYDEDTPHVTADKVTLAGVVQQAADAALSGDGDRSVLQVDGTGFLKANVKATVGLTDAQLRATAVPVSGPLTDAQLRATAVPTTIGPSQGSLTNRSGSITLGGTSQQLAAALATRKYFFLQNIAVEDLWFNFGVAAVADQPSIRLTPGDAFVMEASFVSTEAINIIGATTGSKFVAKEA